MAKNDEQQQRLKRQAEILERVKDLVDRDSLLTAISLVDAAVALIAKQHPAALDAEDRRKIKENYPDATAALMAERAMTEEGVDMVVELALKTTRIALDYSPLSNIQPYFDKDDKVPDSASFAISDSVDQAIRNAVAFGFTTFGAVATILFASVDAALSAGVPRHQFARPLLDALEMTFEDDEPSDKGATQSSR